MVAYFVSSLESLDEIMRKGSNWMYKLMADFERRSPESVFTWPQFVLLLGALTHTLNLMTRMSLAAIADDLVSKKRAADDAAKKGSKKVPRNKGVKKDSKKGPRNKGVKKT